MLIALSTLLSPLSSAQEVMTEADVNRCVRLGIQISELEDFFGRSQRELDMIGGELQSLSQTLDNLESIGAMQQSTLKMCMMNASNSGMPARSYCWSEVQALNETSDKHRNLIGDEENLRAKLRRKEQRHNAKVKTDTKIRNQYDNRCSRPYYTKDYEKSCRGKNHSVFCQ